jgi:hypothetical protein
MKVVEQPNQGGYVSGVGETVGFTVNLTGPVIRNMITNIYSDKEKTVVRELMANAFDAHAASSKSEAISVALPTSLDPTFVVRDYGVGMEHDFIMRMFSSIGYSTKTSSNDMTGMFGVGSKSPLAISDTFTIRCFDAPGWNGGPCMHPNGVADLNETGRVRLYAISFDAEDMPHIHHTFDVPPKDRDDITRGGVEVKVPIKPDIRHKILRGLTEQHFCWFDKPVQFEGAFDDIKDKLYTSVTKIGEGFYLATGDQRNNYGGWNVFVRQGFAVYPADEHLLTKLDDEARSTLETLCKLKGRAVMIDLPIGTADVTMARENLQYNETSITNVCAIINARTAAFRNDLVQVVGDARDYRTAFERLCNGTFYGKINKDDIVSRKAAASLLGLVKSVIRTNYDTWHDTLPDVEDTRAKMDDDGFRLRDENGQEIIEKYTRRPNKNYPQETTHFSNGQFPEGKCILHSTKFRSGSCDQWGLQQSVSFPLISVIYVMTSHTPEWKTRIDRHLQSEFGTTDGFDDVPVYAVRVPKKLLVEANKFVSDKGIAYYVFSEEDLPAPTGTEQKARNYSKTSVYKWEHNAWSEDKIEPDYSEPAYYITRCGITHESFTRHPHKKYDGVFELTAKVDNYSIGQIISNAVACGYIDKDTPVYRVTENQADKIAKTTPEWTHLIEHIAPQVEHDIQNDPHAAFNNSKLSMASLSHEYALMRWIDCAFNIKSDNDAYAYDALKKLTEHDESLTYFLAVRHAMSKHKASVLMGTDKEPVRTLSTRLFRDTNKQVALTGKQQEFDGLHDSFEATHGFLGDIVSKCESSYRGKDLMRHLLFYVNGYCEAVSKKENPAGLYLDLRPVVDVFLEGLNKAEKTRAKFKV